MSGLAVQNIATTEGRQPSVEEAARILRTGGRLVVDNMYAADYAQRLTSLG